MGCAIANVHYVSVHVQTPTHLYYIQMCYCITEDFLHRNIPPKLSILTERLCKDKSWTFQGC